MRYEIHPLNRDFVWRDHEGPFRRLSAEQVSHFDREGYVVLEDVFPPERMAALEEIIDPLDARLDDFVREQKDGRLFIARSGEIIFTTFVVRHSEVAKRFCLDPAFRDICHDLLGPDVSLYHDQAVYKKPGARDPFPWHQDNGYTFVTPQQYLTCWVALTDATEENGCPVVVPGLHRKGTLKHRSSELGFVCLEEVEDEGVLAPVRAGGMVVFSSLTPHATGPNLTRDVRKSYIVQFAPSDARVIRRDADGEEPEGVHGSAIDDPTRQFPLLVAGETAGA